MPKKFDFISPGVQLNEVDQSQLPTPVSDAGPVLIGRARSGPGMKPIRVTSYYAFLAIFVGWGYCAAAAAAATAVTARCMCLCASSSSPIAVISGSPLLL